MAHVEIGSVNENLPAFIALCPGGMPVSRSRKLAFRIFAWRIQGTRVDTSNPDPTRLIDFLQNKRVSSNEQSRQFEFLQQLNAQHFEERPGEAIIESRIKSFELAFRMQTEASDAFDVSQEPEHV